MYKDGKEKYGNVYGVEMELGWVGMGRLCVGDADMKFV